MGWVLGIFITDVSLGYLGLALHCDSTPAVLTCPQASESRPDDTVYVTLTGFTPLLDGAAYTTYNGGKSWQARVPLVPHAVAPRGESVRVVATVSGVSTQEELASVFAAGELTGLLHPRGRMSRPGELESTCPGIPTDFCRQLNVDEHPGNPVLCGGIALAGVLGFGIGFVVLVHGLFGVPDPRPLNGVFVMIPLIPIVHGAGLVLQKVLPRDAAAPLAIGTGVFLFGTGAMQLRDQGLSSLSPYTPGPLSALLIDFGFAMLLLGVYFACRKVPAESTGTPQVRSASPAVATE